jgi:hypothetical protein
LLYSRNFNVAEGEKNRVIKRVARIVRGSAAISRFGPEGARF